MSKFDLQKQTEKARFTVEKRGAKGIRAQIVTALDVSGSARGLFNTGLMQRAWEITMGIAAVFDINGEIDVYTFSDGDNGVAHITPNATPGNFQDYIQKNILEKRHSNLWGATDYAPVIEASLEEFGFYDSSEKKSGGLFGFGGSKSVTKELRAKAKSGEPVVCYFYTDGVNSDKRAIKDLFAQMEKAKTEYYVLFIGVGGADFPFIDELGERFGNVAFVSAKDLDKFATSDDIYDLLIPEEMTEWLKK
jgi:hypothetical protein